MKWLDKWSTINDKDRLTKETFTALHHTTTALLEISEYCLEEPNANYVLLGKFQTDYLEARFGQYRQFAGEQHNVLYICGKFINEKKNSVAYAVLILKISGKDFNLTKFQLDYLSSDFSIAVKNLPVQLFREE